jgi:hypothetical protein
MVEHSAVNRRFAGSNLAARGANLRFRLLENQVERLSDISTLPSTKTHERCA